MHSEKIDKAKRLLSDMHERMQEMMHLLGAPRNESYESEMIDLVNKLSMNVDELGMVVGVTEEGFIDRMLKAGLPTASAHSLYVLTQFAVTVQKVFAVEHFLTQFESQALDSLGPESTPEQREYVAAMVGAFRLTVEQKDRNSSR